MKEKYFAWKPDYELGVQDIDDQHRYFVGLINKFADLFWKLNDTEYQKSLIAELNAYAKFHFISEENMMLLAGYPALPEHQKHHRDLLDRLGAKEAMLMIENTEQRRDDIVEYLVNWFVIHTNKEDRLFAEFLNAKQA